MASLPATDGRPGRSTERPRDWPKHLPCSNLMLLDLRVGTSFDQTISAICVAFQVYKHMPKGEVPPCNHMTVV